MQSHGDDGSTKHKTNNHKGTKKQYDKQGAKNNNKTQGGRSYSKVIEQTHFDVEKQKQQYPQTNKNNTNTKLKSDPDIITSQRHSEQ